MARINHPLFQRKTTESSQGTIFHLITVEIPDNPPLNIVDSNCDITFGGQIYSKFPVSYSGTSMSSDGSIDKATVTVANPGRIFQYFVNDFRALRGTRITIKTTYESFVDFIYTFGSDGSVSTQVNPGADSTAYLEDAFVVDSYTSNETAIVFNLDPVVDFNIRLPRIGFNSNVCRFRYKDPKTCMYSGPLTTCKKTLDDCKLHFYEKADAGLTTIAAGSDVAVTTLPVTPEAGKDSLLIGSTFYKILSVIEGTPLTNQPTSTLGDGRKVVYRRVVYQGVNLKLAAVVPGGASGQGKIVTPNHERYGGFPGVPSGVRRIRL